MRRIPMRLPSLTAVLLLALILAACGAGQPEATRSSPSTPVAETEVAEAHEDDEAHPEDEDHAESEEPHEDEDHAEGEEPHEDEDEHSEGEEHVHLEVPDEYAGLTNPLAGDPEAVADGKELYLGSCATCHGETGLGDGPVAVGLNPPPASFADAEMMADMSDGYIFWRISEGGVGDPFNSAMPAWNFFGEEQIWQLVSFLRTLPGE